jgi:hypothetical protein
LTKNHELHPVAGREPGATVNTVLTVGSSLIVGNTGNRQEPQWAATVPEKVHTQQITACVAHSFSLPGNLEVENKM